MNIYILTSVALFAENGDLDSLDSSSVQVSVPKDGTWLIPSGAFTKCQ